MGIGKVSGHWKANSIPFFDPHDGTQIYHAAILSQDTGQTEDGHNHLSWVRRDVVSVDMVWKALTGNEVTTLINLMQGKAFNLTYYEGGNESVAEVYVLEVRYNKKIETLFSEEGGLCTDIKISALPK